MFGRDNDEIEVTGRDLMRDAASIEGWMRELESLVWSEQIELDDLKREILANLGPNPTENQTQIAISDAIKKFRSDTASRIERIRFLRTTIDASLARARLVETAAIAERWVA